MTLDLEVMRASEMLGEIVARTICAEVPGLDCSGLAKACAAEVFAACQDMRVLAEVEGQQATARLRALYERGDRS